MKAIIVSNDNLEIKPKAFEGEDTCPIFVFRYPNTYDFMQSLTSKNDFDLLNNLFIEVKNLEFVDAQGEPKKLENYQEIFSLTLDARFASAHFEIVQEISKWFNKLSDEGKKVEKKSKSGGKSTKTKNQS